jgi:hypothetical protein
VIVRVLNFLVGTEEYVGEGTAEAEEGGAKVRLVDLTSAGCVGVLFCLGDGLALTFGCFLVNACCVLVVVV